MLRRYLSKLLLVRVLGCLLGLAAIAQLLDLLDKTGQLLMRGGVGAILHYIALRLPATLSELIALATLIGGLVTFTGLARSHEMTIIAGTGLSLRQVLVSLLPACLLLAGLQFIFQTELAPHSERAVADWWAATTPADTVADSAHTLWLRFGRDAVALDQVALDGRDVSGVEILTRKPNGDLDKRIGAARGRWLDHGWVLEDVRIAAPTQTASQTPDQYLDHLDWPALPSPTNLVALSRPVESQSLDRLIATEIGAWIGARGPRYGSTQIQALIASVFDPLVMLVLALPLALAPPRAETTALALLRTLALGLAYLAAVGLLDALGNAGTLPGPVAAWMALLAFGGYGMARLMAADLG